MKIKNVLIIGLALSISAGSMFAENSNSPSQRRGSAFKRGGQGGQGGGQQQGDQNPQLNGGQSQGGQTPPQNGHDKGQRPPPPPIIMALDANKDGTISADEIANAANALLTLDKNGDGQLTKEEICPPRNDGGQRPPPPSGGKGKQPPVPPVMAALDTDRDGVISAAEIANAPASLLTLDKNGDGQLTKEELRPPLPPKN